ncbi:MAG: MerR family transcriptional regulator [Eubacterium sp.]|nr:MerR family transcriptional regulator [Eubacterium sp.]
MYTIGKISEMFKLPISTLRYYDREGLFPNMKRDSGIRKFGEEEIETLRVIECLKKSGLEIKDIKQFIAWCREGAETYPKRLALFKAQRAQVEAEIDRMNQVLDMIVYKTWYYETALAEGSEARLAAMAPQDMPADIRAAYENAHRQL